MMPAIPYSLTDGCSTLVGQALTQRLHAVHLEVKGAMPDDPGGDTGYNRSSFTVESFVGTGLLSCERIICDPPASRMIDPVMNLRREVSVSTDGREDLILTRSYAIAFSLQASRQLKQLTHLLVSICLFRKSMHEDLHTMAHLPQRVHFSSSNRILKRDALLRMPRKVPTGQTVLQ